MRCSLCRQIIVKEEDGVNFPAFLVPEHPLYPHADSWMHLTCYRDWPQQQEFETLYAQDYRKLLKRILATW